MGNCGKFIIYTLYGVKMYLFLNYFPKESTAGHMMECSKKNNKPNKNNLE